MEQESYQYTGRSDNSLSSFEYKFLLISTLVYLLNLLGDLRYLDLTYHTLINSSCIACLVPCEDRIAFFKVLPISSHISQDIKDFRNVFVSSIGLFDE